MCVLWLLREVGHSCLSGTRTRGIEMGVCKRGLEFDVFSFF